MRKKVGKGLIGMVLAITLIGFAGFAAAQDKAADNMDLVKDKIRADKKLFMATNMQLTEQTKKMFFLVSYNIDKFKAFVFESSFLDRYDIDAETIEKIKADDIALLKFGLKWLKDVLFKEGSYKLKEDANS